MDLVTAAYQATERFPKDELFGLTSQARRAAVSIPATLRKVKPGFPQRSLGISWGRQEAHWWN